MRVAVIGKGAIGTRVARALADGQAPGAWLMGVMVRRPGTGAPHRELTVDDLTTEADLVVECAGSEAARRVGPRIVRAGKDLLLVSVGVLADPDLRHALLEQGPGRTFVSTGAIGGLNLLAAASRGGGLDRVTLTTRKLPRALIQPWMDGQARHELLNTKEPVTIFDGDVALAVERFPASLNVAVALAHATGLWKDTTVHLVADPSAGLTNHRISASGDSGTYDFSIENAPAPENPATSGVVADAVLEGITTLAGGSGRIV